ncbi:unnamed protein product, partial [Closterium sp. NIES-53]
MPPRLVIPCLPGDTEADATASAAAGVDIPAALGAGEGSNLAGATNDSTMASGRLPSPLLLIDSMWEGTDPTNLWSADSSLDESPLILP